MFLLNNTFIQVIADTLEMFNLLTMNRVFTS